jgi:hypothetical protein
VTLMLDKVPSGKGAARTTEQDGKETGVWVQDSFCELRDSEIPGRNRTKPEQTVTITRRRV